MTSPQHATTAQGGSRSYKHPETGETAASVTTIISTCVAKQALQHWARNVTAEWAVENYRRWSTLSQPTATQLVKSEAKKLMEQGRDLGTIVHGLCEERVLTGSAPQIDVPAAVPYLEQFERFLVERRPEFLHTEATVWSRKHGYAGTLDAVATLDDELTLIDIKSGKAVYFEAALQLAAYRYADFILAADGSELPLPLVDRAVVLHLRPDEYHVLPVDTSPPVFDAFLCAQELCGFINGQARSVIGAAS